MTGVVAALSGCKLDNIPKDAVDEVDEVDEEELMSINI
jgi:hypothetical protein